jgi:hypothetical protein
VTPLALMPAALEATASETIAPKVRSLIPVRMMSSNASIERTHTGMALRPRSAQAHVAPGGLHAMPVRPAHVER